VTAYNGGPVTALPDDMMLVPARRIAWPPFSASTAKAPREFVVAVPVKSIRLPSPVDTSAQLPVPLAPPVTKTLPEYVTAPPDWATMPCMLFVTPDAGVRSIVAPLASILLPESKAAKPI
jgi:hypothetical protein